MTPPIQELPLRDIHLPPPISWWPPAPGWWALLGLMIVIAILVASIRYIWTGRRLRRIALAELEGLDHGFRASQDPKELVRALSVLLRRVCMSRFPRAKVAGLTGEDWLHFLDTGLKRNPYGFSQGPGRVLVDAPYQPSVQFDGHALIALCRVWVKSLPASRRRARR